jgi:hypothetical protein
MRKRTTTSPQATRDLIINVPCVPAFPKVRTYYRHQQVQVQCRKVGHVPKRTSDDGTYLRVVLDKEVKFRLSRANMNGTRSTTLQQSEAFLELLDL